MICNLSISYFWCQNLTTVSYVTCAGQINKAPVFVDSLFNVPTIVRGVLCLVLALLYIT